MADPTNPPRDPRVNPGPNPVVPNVPNQGPSPDPRDQRGFLPGDPRLNPPAERVVPSVGPSPDPRVPHPVTGLLPERPPEVIVTRQTPEQVQGIHAQLEEGLMARVHGRLTEITGHSNRLVAEFEALRNKVTSLETRVNQVTPEVPNDRLATLQAQFDALVARVEAHQARLDVGGRVVGSAPGEPPSLITRQVSGEKPQVVQGVPTPVGQTQAQIDAERQARERAQQAGQREPGDDV